MRPVSVASIGRRFGVTRDAVVKWRNRYPDFPEPIETHPYPLYNLGQVEGWYARRWPQRVENLATKIFRYKVTPGGATLTTINMGSMDTARGYLKGVRDARFGGDEWRVFSTPDGFSAHQGSEVEVWVLDPSSAEPEPWYVYDSRFKAAGRVA